MKLAAHLEKIAKLERTRARLAPDADFELWFWATMNLGTHMVNAALHDCGATIAEDTYPTQPGVYLVPGTGTALEPRFRPLGDVMHVGRPKVETPVPEDVAAMMRAMEVIEHHRDPCIRGERTPTPAIARECDEALATVRTLFERRMPSFTR